MIIILQANYYLRDTLYVGYCLLSFTLCSWS